MTKITKATNTTQPLLWIQAKVGSQRFADIKWSIGIFRLVCWMPLTVSFVALLTFFSFEVDLITSCKVPYFVYRVWIYFSFLRETKQINLLFVRYLNMTSRRKYFILYSEIVRGSLLYLFPHYIFIPVQKLLRRCSVLFKYLDPPVYY